MCRLHFLCEKLQELVHLYKWYYRSRVSYAYDTELIFIVSETDSLQFMQLQRGTTSLKIDKRTGNKITTEAG